jgi:proline iminopeptidase
VDDRHTLHVEEAGNPDGVPVVFLHGGPGLAWSRAIYRFFDPDHYRIVAFDQRGTDRSTPLGELRDNTTAHLMADIEHLRGLLGIERWIVFGGSWGSALALAYALHHPERVMALVVRGIYLGEPEDDIFAFTHCRMLFPEAWHALAAFFPQADHGDLFHAIARDLHDRDPEREDEHDDVEAPSTSEEAEAPEADGTPGDA